MAMTQAKFWDKTAPKYSQQAIGDPDSYAKKLKATQALMHKNMEVIEFGCGTGSTALLHAPHVKHITATDISARMVAIGREKAEQASIHNLSFQQCSVEEVDTSKAYDMVLALNLIHLLSDIPTAFDTFARLTKPGGYFITSTVCLADKRWLLAPLIKVMQMLGKAPHVGFISPETVMAQMQAAGFECQEHWTHGKVRSLFIIAKKSES